MSLCTREATCRGIPCRRDLSRKSFALAKWSPYGDLSLDCPVLRLPRLLGNGSAGLAIFLETGLQPCEIFHCRVCLGSQCTLQTATYQACGFLLHALLSLTLSSLLSTAWLTHAALKSGLGFPQSSLCTITVPFPESLASSHLVPIAFRSRFGDSVPIRSELTCSDFGRPATCDATRPGQLCVYIYIYIERERERYSAGRYFNVESWRTHCVFLFCSIETTNLKEHRTSTYTSWQNNNASPLSEIQLVLTRLGRSIVPLIQRHC